MKRFAAITLAALISAPICAHADDITDQINEALKAYKAKDLETAMMALDSASTLIRQQRADNLAELLPQPLPGWVSEADDTSTGANAAMFGGGTNAERVYRQQKDDDYKEIRITITGDSMMIQSMSLLFSNPMFMSGRDQKLVVIDGRKVMQDSAEGSLTTMVNNKALVVVNASSNEPAMMDAAKRYFNAVNFKKLEAMMK
jgi:hypothetical protein